jgi:hypothetical protein
VTSGGVPGGAVRHLSFHRLPARPMVIVEIESRGVDRARMERLVGEAIDGAPADAVLQIRVLGLPHADVFAALRGPTLRARAPATMNVEVALPDVRRVQQE